MGDALALAARGRDSSFLEFALTEARKLKPQEANVAAATKAGLARLRRLEWIRGRHGCQKTNREEREAPEGRRGGVNGRGDIWGATPGSGLGPGPMHARLKPQEANVAAAIQAGQCHGHMISVHGMLITRRDALSVTRSRERMR